MLSEACNMQESTGLTGGREQNGDIKAHIISQFVIILSVKRPDQDNDQSTKMPGKQTLKRKTMPLFK